MNYLLFLARTTIECLGKKGNEGSKFGPLKFFKGGTFGDYICDSPYQLIKSAADVMKNHSDTDFVFWTG